MERKFFDNIGVEIKEGYRTYWGHILTEWEAKEYNSFTLSIERAEENNWKEEAEFLKDQRHRFFITLFLYDEKAKKQQTKKMELAQ